MELDRRLILGLFAAAVVSPVRARQTLESLVDPDGASPVLGLGLIARDAAGQIVLAEAHGRGLADGRFRPFTLDTPVRVASISKMIATAGFMRLVEAGHVGLDDDLSDLAGFRLRHPLFPEEPITARRLASHTAGLRNGETFPVPLGRRLEEALAADGPLSGGGSWWSPSGQPPGWFAYADVNVAVLAQVMERATGERFDRLMHRLLFQPLGLDVGYNWSGVSKAKRDLASACCRLVDGAWVPEVDGRVARAPAVWINPDPEQPGIGADHYRLGDNGFAFSPQGGLRASVRDLDRLGLMFSRGLGPLSGQSLAVMADPVWTFDPLAANGDTDRGLITRYGLHVQAAGGAASDAFFGAGSADWRGHFGEAYGLVSGLFWNLRDGRQVAWIINGTPADATLERLPELAITPWEAALLRRVPPPG